jgi:beta-ribofuranosylaminobenzene 5'-phosphate synthase
MRVKKIRIETGSRLHFGLLDLSGDLGRVDGGVGVAVCRPRLVIEATPSKETVANRRPELVVDVVSTLRHHYGIQDALTVNVTDDYPSHVGLGSSTQFILAVGTAYSRLNNIENSPRELAGILGRAGTSGIGLAAFESGGLIADGGHSFGPKKEKEGFLPSSASPAPPAPVVARIPIDPDWLFDIIVLDTPTTVSGKPEIEFFSRHCPIDPIETGTVARAILSLILPGAATHDIDTFARGINLITTLGFKRYEIANQFNNVKSTIDNLHNITPESFGIGMSSFGPTVFLVSNKDARSDIEHEIMSQINRALDRYGGFHVCTKARNVGASIRLIEN